MKYEIRHIAPRYAQGCYDVQHSGAEFQELTSSLWSLDTWTWISRNCNDTFIVTDEDDRVLAYWLGVVQVCNIPYDKERHGKLSCCAIDACVHKDFRNTGVMNEMMKTISQYHESVYTWTPIDNVVTQHVMESWGYIRHSRRKDWYGPGEDAYYYTYDRG
tara:strand:- start:804 stop:1283 length:480 start_codon:yes stop_codon:yes gene_type:complete